MNDWPSVPDALVGLVITGGAGGAGCELSINVPLPVPPAFVALRFTGKLPLDVGVPLMRPLLELMESPDGNPVAPYVAGAFVAVI